MSSDLNVNMIGKDMVTPAAEKATESLEKVSEAATKSGKKTSKAARGAQKDWGGLSNLFGSLLPRGLQRTVRQFQSTTRQVGRLSKGFKVLKGAIAATGIGLLIIALGEIVANWDKISGSVTKASEATRAQVRAAQELVDVSQQELDIISQTENILRESGSTEEDILAMRIAGTEQAILAQQLLIQNTAAENEESIRKAKQWETFGTLVMVALTAPFLLLLKAVDDISEALVFMGVLDEKLNTAGDLLDWESKALFDPEKMSEEGEAAIKKLEESLLAMEDQLAGYRLKVEKNEENAANKAKQNQDKIDRQKEADAKFVANRILRLRNDMELQGIEDADLQAKKRLEHQYEADKKELEQKEDSFIALLLLRQKYDMDVAALEGTAEDREKAAQAKIDIDQAALKEELYQRTLYDDELEMARLEAERDRQLAIAVGNDELIEAVEQAHLDKIGEMEQAARDRSNEAREEDEQMKLSGQQKLMNASMSMFRTMGQLAEKDSAQKRQLAIADVLLNQAMAMANAVKTAGTFAKDPYTFIASIITMVGAVLTSFSQIKGILAQGGAASGGVGGGNSQVRSGFADNSVTPLPAVTDTPEMQAYVVQSQLEGQQAFSHRLTAKTTL
tara:strand:+ start:788 stop:2647 length:1860 start_codon:yes stop_codon:yes gene_type:complete